MVQQSWRILRQLGALWAGLGAGVATFAAVASSLPGRPTGTQLGWASLAAVLTGTLAFVQLHKDRGKTATQGTVQIAEREPAVELFQLPPDIGDFTGRSDTMARVRDLLLQRSGAVVISAIAGKGGVGKTALAVHLAHQLRSEFPDGQLYVNLRGAEAEALDPGEVLAGFLRQLGVAGAAIPEGSHERAALYRARLAGKRILLLLDNAASEAQVRPLLPGSGTCAVLVTSRAPLSGIEAAIPVPLEVLAPAEAGELLAKVVGAERVAAEPAAAESIVRVCGGLPLAVRIAGAKLAAKPHWSLERFVERLADERRRLDELQAGDQEVRATFALSYRRRDQEEQRAFRRLGLLVGPDFAAWVVATMLESELVDAEELVERLVEAQLLEVAGEDGDGQIRYRFHDLLRVFARERFRQEEPPVAQRVALRRLLGAYLDRAEQADRRLKSGDAGDLATIEASLAWLSSERANLVGAVEQARQAELWALSWRLASALSRFLEQRSLWNDWEQTQQHALAAARQAGDRQQEADALLKLARIYREQGRYDQAMEAVDRCLPAFHELGDRSGAAWALSNRGRIQDHQGHLRAAIASLTESRTIFAELGDRLGEAYALHSLGEVYRSQGRLSEAIACFEQCLPVFRDLGDRPDEAWTLRNRGLVLFGKGRSDDALAQLNQSLARFHALGHRSGEALALRGRATVYQAWGRFDDALAQLDQGRAILGDQATRQDQANDLLVRGRIRANQGRFQEAMADLDQSLILIREMGIPLLEGMVLHAKGDVCRDHGYLDAAADQLDKALAVHRALGSRHGEAWTLLSQARTLRIRGRYADAHARLDQSESLFRTHGIMGGAASVLHGRGEVLADQERFSQALGCFDHSLLIFRDLGSPTGQVQALHSRGDVLRDQGDLDQAMGCLEEAWSIVQQLQSPFWEAWVLLSQGDTFRAQARFEEALACFDQCQLRLDEFPSRLGQVWVLRGRGAVYQAQGRLEEALACFDQCVPVLQEIGFRLWLAKTLVHRGATLAALGDDEAAAAASRAALAIFQDLGLSGAPR
jgi:tetratricopeptide (TPR) repeat protein